MSNQIFFRPPPEIGVLGTGRMGVRLASMYAKAGRRVLLGSRDPARAGEIVHDLAIPGLSAGSYEEALEAEAVLPAVFIRDGLFELLDRYASRLDNKLLIDISNPFNEDYSDFITPWDTSGAEELQKRVPNAHVVGAFKNVFWAVFDDPLFVGTPSDVLVVGDNAPAKQQFFALSEDTPFRYLDAGALINARAIERMTMITGALGRSLGSYPRMNWRLLG
ncbi:MAG TPA: NAD(P)-binding domain-containing protein [Allosphingosinicella sp.]|uniref:NADPH-dependent F420 reductase n=1 Tax=Allosphingosinicella sp. TaxID=2823234 RepID=UPI002EDB3A87